MVELYDGGGGLPYLGSTTSYNAGDWENALRTYHDSGVYLHQVAQIDAIAEKAIEQGRPRTRLGARKLRHARGRPRRRTATSAQEPRDRARHRRDVAVELLRDQRRQLHVRHRTRRPRRPTRSARRSRRRSTLFNDAKARGVRSSSSPAAARPRARTPRATCTREGFTGWQAARASSRTPRPTPPSPTRPARGPAIEKQGYRIVANVGDQYSDLAGGHADVGVQARQPVLLPALGCSRTASTPVSGSPSRRPGWRSGSTRSGRRCGCHSPGRSSAERPPARTGRSTSASRSGRCSRRYWLRGVGTVARRLGRRARRPAARHRRRGDAVARRRAGPGPEHGRAPAAAGGDAARRAARRRARRRRARARVQRPVRVRRGRPGAASWTFALRRCELARFDRDAWDAVVRRLAAGRARVARRASTRRGRASCSPQLYAFTLDGDRERAAPPARPRLRRAAGAVGDRPRAPRHRVAVAAGGDLAQARAHARPRSCGCSTSTPSTSSRTRRPSTTRGSRSATPDAVRARPRGASPPAAGSRSAAPGSSPTATCPPASRSHASSSTASASSSASSARRCTRVLEPGRVRLHRPAAAAHARGRASTRFLTQKLSWNRFNAARAPHVHVAGARRLGGADALPAGRHLQRRGDRRGAAPLVAPPTRTTAARSTPCSCSATATAAAGRRAAMLERLRRAARPRRACRAPSCARRPRSSTTLEADARDLRTVVGELYFEYHRGTYTSQAAIKRGNRRGERALHDAELHVARSRGAYPREALDRLWRTLLLNQFHDILPGSSIARGQRARRARPGARSRRAPRR